MDEPKLAEGVSELEAEPDESRLPVQFVGDFDVPIVLADNFSLHTQVGLVILTVAQLRAPVLVGSQEEKRAQFEQLTHIPIHVLARFAMSTEVLEALIVALREHRSKMPDNGS